MRLFKIIQKQFNPFALFPMQITSRTSDRWGLPASPAASRTEVSGRKRQTAGSENLKWGALRQFPEYSGEVRESWTSESSWTRNAERKASGNHWQPTLFGDFPCADLVTRSEFGACSVLGFGPNSKHKIKGKTTSDLPQDISKLLNNPSN